MAANVVDVFSRFGDPKGADIGDDLQAFIDGLPNGTTLAWPPDVEYRSERGIRVEHKEMFASIGARIVASDPAPFDDERLDRTRAHWFVSECQDVSIIGGTITGPAGFLGTQLTPGVYVPEYEAQHGVWVNKSQRVHTEGIRIRNVLGDFVYLGIKVQDAVVRRMNCVGASRQGFTCVFVSRATFGDATDHTMANLIKNCGRHNIDIEPLAEHHVNEDLHFGFGYAGSSRLGFFASGPYAGIRRRWHFHDWSGPRMGLWLGWDRADPNDPTDSFEDVLIERLVATGDLPPGPTPFRMVNARNVGVYDCKIPTREKDQPVKLFNVDGFSEAGNDFEPTTKGVYRSESTKRPYDCLRSPKAPDISWLDANLEAMSAA